MPTLQSVMPPMPIIYEPPSDLRRFVIRPPEGVVIDSIKGWISDPNGSRVEFTADALDAIVMDVIYASTGRTYTIVGYQRGLPVAEYTGESMDLDIVDIINLRFVVVEQE